MFTKAQTKRRRIRKMNKFHKIMAWNPTPEQTTRIRNMLIRISFYGLACMIFLYIGSEREAYTVKQELKYLLLDKEATEKENKQWIQNYYELANQANHLGKQIHYMRLRHERQIDDIREQAELVKMDLQNSKAAIQAELQAATAKLKILETDIGLTKKQINALEAVKKK